MNMKCFKGHCKRLFTLFNTFMIRIKIQPIEFVLKTFENLEITVTVFVNVTLYECKTIIIDSIVKKLVINTINLLFNRSKNVLNF